MVLMRKCGVKLENDSLQTLLRFLLYTKHDEILVGKLITRIYKDKKMKLTYIECISLTLILMKQININNRFLKLSSPIFYNENYLNIFPESIYKVCCFILSTNHNFHH